MQVTINIEQYDNGIALKWRDDEGRTDPGAIISYDRDKESVIGKMIWDDIKAVMDRHTANTVRMEITYTPIKEDEP